MVLLGGGLSFIKIFQKVSQQTGAAYWAGRVNIAPQPYFLSGIYINKMVGVQ